MGGKPVDPPNKYPWLVQLRAPEEAKVRCNGVIFDKRWIITTYTCISRFTRDNDTIRVAKWVTALHDRVQLDNFSQTVTSVEFIKHPNFE